MAFQTLSPGTLLSPVPAVMVSCAMPGKRPNVITIAWAGTVCSADVVYFRAQGALFAPYPAGKR